MQNAVDLRAVFFHNANPYPRNSEQFPRRTGTLVRNGSQCLVAHDTECRRPPPSGFGETPGAQRLFQAGVGWLLSFGCPSRLLLHSWRFLDAGAAFMTRLTAVV